MNRPPPTAPPLPLMSAPAPAPEKAPVTRPLSTGLPSTVHPKRLRFAETLAQVPMLGTIAAHYAQAPKAELRAEAAEIHAAKAALWATLDEHGIQDAIPVTWMAEKVAGQDKPRRFLQAWDGRHRTEWALAREEKTVPVRHVTEEEGRALLESTVVGRRHWTKGQLAWLAVNLHPAVAENTKGRPGKSDSIGITTTELGSRYGVSADLIDQAVKIFRLFSAAPSLREKYESGIWLGHGLGAVLAGIPGGETTTDKPKKPLGFGSFSGPFGTMNTLAKAYEKWSPDEQSACRDAWTIWLRHLPEAFRLTITEAVACASEGEDSAE